MLNKIIEFSIKNKLIIGLMIIALIGYGSYQVTQLPIDAVPDITNNQVQIITTAPSYGALDIERLITFPIEQANSNISGIKEIRSFSRFGLSLVTIVFDDETDVYWARQQVSERLIDIQNQIPASIGTPSLGPITTGLGEIYQYVVRTKKGYEHKYNTTDLRTIQDWVIRRQLIGVKGVAEVSSFGGKLKQYEIAINTDKLHAQNITINDVFNALESNNQNTGGAYIEKGPTILSIRTEGLIKSIADIENIAIPLPGRSGIVFIRDIATINIGYATRYGALGYNDEGEVAGAIVMMLKGANSSEVINNVKERIAQIQKTLPEGIEIEPFLDRTKMVNNAIGTVEKNLLEGALIVIFVLVLFLGNFRAGLIVASVIPLAMLFAISLMNLFGVSGNLMSLGALDFGLIVDGAVIIVEAVMHQLYHNNKLKKVGQLDQKQMDETVIHSAGRMMNSAVFGQIIILIVYLPIFTLQGIEGKMFKPMAQTVAFALLGAFILSLTYIPMMSAFFLSKNTHHKQNISDRMMEKIQQAYMRSLTKIMRYPKFAITSILGLFVLAILIFSRLGGEFIPTLEEGDFAVETRILTGSNLQTSIDYTQKAAGILKKRFPEVEKVVTKTGSGEVPTDPMPMEASDMMVILKDKSTWTSAESFDELAEKMTTALEEIPGLSVGFQYPVQMRFNELMTGARQDVVCKIFGENLDTLAYYAEKVDKITKSIQGAENIYLEPITGMPQIVIEYNRAIIAQYNLNISDINRIVNVAFAGQSTGLVFEDEKRFELVVRLHEDGRKNIEDVQNLLIPLSNGGQIPLHQLAKVEVKNGPNQIQREDAKRRIIVGFNIHGRDVQSIVEELQKKVNQSIKFPTGYYITYGGAFENLEQAKKRLMIAVPVSLLLIFVLLFFAFNSVKHGLLIYTAIPLSAIGGIFFLALRDMPFSISAGVGFIALFGVAVLNGIVLIAEFNRQKLAHPYSLSRIVISGAKLRLRPVMMTAFVASLGFLPMALSNGAGAEVQRPLATVVIGGLMVATLLTLYILPILYILFENSNKKVKIMNSTKLKTMLFFMLFGLQSFGQNTINIEKAVEIAKVNNQQITNEKLKSDYSKALIKTSMDIPKTSINGEFGQINSAYTDTRFSIGQSMAFPTIYSKQKQVYREEWKSSMIQISIVENEIKQLVYDCFYYYLYLKGKEDLLNRVDSMYASFLEKSSLRFQKGESNILEQVTAENQRANIRIQLLDLNQEKEITLLRFQYLLNSTIPYIPESNSLIMPYNLLSDTGINIHHPKLQNLEQQMIISKARTAYEKSKFLPNLNLSYNNMSMIGTGSDNVLYNAKTRFQSAQIGIEIPLLYQNNQAKLKSSRIAETIARNEFQLGKFNIEMEYKKALNQFKKKLEIVQYYENTGNKHAKTIVEIAHLQFYNGEINYLDWVTLINQSISIQNNYLDAIRSLNQSISSINSITLKP